MKRSRSVPVLLPVLFMAAAMSLAAGGCGHPDAGLKEEPVMPGWNETAAGTVYMYEDGKPARGLVKIRDRYYLFNEEGVLCRGGWNVYREKRYYITADGSCAEGLLDIDGDFYYFYPEDYPVSRDSVCSAADGWVYSGGKSHYFEDCRLTNKAPSMDLYVYDYGNDDGAYGDAVLLCSEGHFLLMDTCSEDDGIISWLEEKLDGKPCSIYVSHYHDDHMGNVSGILKSGIDVETLYMPDTGYMDTDSGLFSKEKEMLGQIIDDAGREGVRIQYLDTGTEFTAGSCGFEVLLLNRDAEHQDLADRDAVNRYINNCSLVTKVTCGDISFLTAGDIEKETEEELIEKNADINAQIFKMDHHGGNTSNIPAFIKRVSPCIAFSTFPGSRDRLLCSGWVNEPAETVQEYASLFNTRYNGDIHISVQNGRISVDGESHMRTGKVEAYNADTGKIEDAGIRLCDTGTVPDSVYLLPEGYFPADMCPGQDADPAPEPSCAGGRSCAFTRGGKWSRIKPDLRHGLPNMKDGSSRFKNYLNRREPSLMFFYCGFLLRFFI